MPSLSLSPVAAAVHARLAVPALLSLAPGGVGDDIPQVPAYPLVLVTVQERGDLRGFGEGGLPEVEIRTSVHSTYAGWAEAQAVAQVVVQRLKDAPLAVAGYAQCGRVVYDRTVPVPESVIHGVKTRELVSLFWLWVEEL